MYTKILAPFLVLISIVLISCVSQGPVDSAIKNSENVQECDESNMLEQCAQYIQHVE